MPKVAIFTNFRSYDKGYSLCIVAADQVKMFLANGYEIVVVVAEPFKPEGPFAEKGVEIRRIPAVPVHNQAMIDETFKQDVVELKKATLEALKDRDVVLTHDLIYQPDYMKHNIACRELIAEHECMKNIRWLHWVHSATPPYTLSQELGRGGEVFANLLRAKFPNSFIVFPNSFSVPRVAKAFNVPEHEIKVVPHPTDICEFLGMDEFMTRFTYQNNLLETDAIAVYPARLDNGKQVEVVFKTMAGLKDYGTSVRAIVMDFASTSKDPNDPKFKYREELKKLAVDWGLSEGEFIFMSEFEDNHSYTWPHQYVRQLYQLSNIFVMPSASETYSLVTQEAALCGNLLILNQDFLPFRGIYGEHALYAKFSSKFDVLDWSKADGAFTETKYSNERAFYRELAAKIRYHLSDNIVIAQKDERRKKNNLRAIFRNHLEPLLYAGQ